MRILFFTDIHHDTGDKKHYPATAHVLPVLWDFLQKEKDNTDLVIIGGDLTVRGPASMGEIESFKNKMDKTGIPYVALPGNHDLAPSKVFARMYPGMEDYEEGALIDTNYGRVFKGEGLRYYKKFESLSLVGFAIRDDDPDGQLEWLEEKLSSEEEKLVFCHYPLVPARDGGFCSRWEYKRIGNVIDRLALLVGDPKNHVLAYFCGHLHINSKKPLGSTIQVVNGASGLATVCYKEILIGDREIKVDTFMLPGFDDFQGDLMNEDESTDIKHKTIKEYHWGTGDETRFTIKRNI